MNNANNDVHSTFSSHAMHLLIVDLEVSSYNRDPGLLVYEPTAPPNLGFHGHPGFCLPICKIDVSPDFKWRLEFQITGSHRASVVTGIERRAWNRCRDCMQWLEG